MPTTQTTTTKGQSAVDIAKGYIGLIPYHLGASVTNTQKLAYADCSSFVQFVYGQVGYSLPRTASAQYKATKTTVIANPSTKNLKPGDLLFFGGWNTPDNPPGYGGVQHVGIYAGNGFVINEGAGTTGGTNVGTDTLKSYGTHLIAATRPLGDATTTVATQTVADATIADTTNVESLQSFLTHVAPLTDWSKHTVDDNILSMMKEVIPSTVVGKDEYLNTLESYKGQKLSDVPVPASVANSVDNLQGKSLVTVLGFVDPSSGWNGFQTVTQSDINMISGLIPDSNPDKSSFIAKLYINKANGTLLKDIPVLDNVANDMATNAGKKGFQNIWAPIPDLWQSTDTSQGKPIVAPTDIAGALNGISDLIGKLTNPANWLHIGAMLAGVGLVGFGLYMGLKDISAPEQSGGGSPMPIILKEGA
jgi:hypothetical protein